MPRHRRRWHLLGGKRWAFPWLFLLPGRTFCKWTVRDGVLDGNKKYIYIKRNGGESLEVEVVRVEWVCLQLNGIYPYSYLYLVFLFAL